MLFPDHQVVALARQRDEVQPEHPCRRASRHAAIHCAGLHLPGRGEMARCEPFITTNIFGRDFQPFEPRVQQCPAAGAWFPIHNRDILSREVFHTVDGFRVPIRGHDTLFPNGKADHRDRVFWKQPSDFRQIGFTARLVSEVRPGDVNATFFEQGQGL